MQGCSLIWGSGSFQAPCGWQNSGPCSCGMKLSSGNCSHSRRPPSSHVAPSNCSHHGHLHLPRPSEGHLSDASPSFKALPTIRSGPPQVSHVSCHSHRIGLWGRPWAISGSCSPYHPRGGGGGASAVRAEWEWEDSWGCRSWKGVAKEVILPVPKKSQKGANKGVSSNTHRCLLRVHFTHWPGSGE